MAREGLASAVKNASRRLRGTQAGLTFEVDVLVCSASEEAAARGAGGLQAAQDAPPPGNRWPAGAFA